MVTALTTVTKKARGEKANNVASPMPTRILMDASTPGIDPQDFIRDNRIHIKQGSHFVDGYLVIHPRETTAENEPKLREKLKLTFSVIDPSFFEDKKQHDIALGLSQLIAPSLAARHAQQQAGIAEINQEVETGVSARFKKQRDNRAEPMAANFREITEKPENDAVGMETLKNGLTLFLMMREKLTQAGFTKPLTSYVGGAAPDQILTVLGNRLGFTPITMINAAASGGIDGVAKALSIAPEQLAEIRTVVDRASQRQFSQNIVRNWNAGNQLMPAQASIEQKLAAGLNARVDEAIADARREFKGKHDVPMSTQAQEKQVVQSMMLLDPIQRALMHKTGVEVCYSPEYYPTDIAFYPNIKGLNRRATMEPGGIQGTTHIYYSAYEGLKESERVLAHEAAHIFMPNQFTPEQVKKIDMLAASDGDRFKRLGKLVDEQFPAFEKFLNMYKAGNDAEKAAIRQDANAQFAKYGVSIGDGLLPYMQDANELRYLTKYANEKLNVEGAFYTGSSYSGAPQRFREVISRFAELKQVELKGEPQLMQFLAPGLNAVWENHYLPHLAKVYSQIVAGEKGKGGLATSHKDVAQPAAAACIAELVPNTKVSTDGAHFDGMGLSNPAIAAANQVLSTMGIRGA